MSLIAYKCRQGVTQSPTGLVIGRDSTGTCPDDHGEAALPPIEFDVQVGTVGYGPLW